MSTDCPEIDYDDHADQWLVYCSACGEELSEEEVEEGYDDCTSCRDEKDEVEEDGEPVKPSQREQQEERADYMRDQMRDDRATGQDYETLREKGLL